ncbi:hypothetical protein Tco_0971918 [Tanacetum coccineum]
MTLAASTNKSLKSFDELMSTPINFSAYIMNGLNITNLTQETLLGPAFRLLKGTPTNYAELEYDFEEFMSGNHHKVPVDYFFNNDLKYLQGGVSTMTYTTSITKTKAAQYDLPGIKDMTFYGYARGLESRHDVYSTKRILAVTQVEVMRKHGYGYLKEIVVRIVDNDLYTFNEGEFPRLCINDIEDMLLLVVQSRLTNSRAIVFRLRNSIENVHQKLGYSEASQRSLTGSRKLLEEDQRKNRLMRSDELYKFSDRTLTGLRTSLDDITKSIQMEYLPQRRWSTLEKKKANIMIKAIDKQLKDRRLMRSLEKFIGERHYGTDPQLLQRTI